jgi:hypothetical protein
MKTTENRKEKVSKEAVKDNSSAGIVEELDIENLGEVTGGSLRSTIRTKTQDISGDTKSKI